MAFTFDLHKNFVTTTINTPPSPAAPSTGATSVFTVAGGTSAFFPQVFPYNCIIYTAGIFPNYLNTEIVTVTNINTGSDTLTVTRGAESSTVQTVISGNIIAMTVTAKNFQDVEAAINVNAGNIATNTASINTINSEIAAIPHYSDITDNTSNHRIGINQVTPAYTLDVTGDINFTGNIRQNGTIFSGGGGGTTYPDITDNSSTHKIGIVQTSPAYTLDVNGLIGNSAFGNTNTLTLDDGSNTAILTTYNAALVNSNKCTISSTNYNLLQATGFYQSVQYNGIVFSSGNVRFKDGKGWQFFNSTTGLWHTKLCVGNPPQDGWDAGDSDSLAIF